MLRKISRLLQAVHFNFDNRDRINTLIALLAYWEAKCETQYEESTIEFAEAIKDRILRQRQELDTMRSKRHPTPEKLTIQLVPSSEEVASRLVSAGHNPKLQLTLKSKKSMASIIEHLNSKWTAPTGTTLSDTPLRLYVPDKLGQGYGVEAQDVTILSVFHAMNCPAICRLEYNWDPDYGKMVDGAGGVLPGHEHQELQSTSDEHSTGDEHSTDSHRSSGSVSAHNTRTRTGSPTRTAAVATTSPRHNSGSPPRSGSHHSPRSTSVNRLAVPENVRGSAKVLSEDALDDDAIRQGQIMRKATKPGSKGSFKPASPGSSTSPKNSPTRASRASPPHQAAGMGSRATRYSMRSRRAAAATTAAPSAASASSGSAMERSREQAMDASMPQQQQYSDLQMYADSVDSEDGLMNDVTGEFYGEPSSELENLEAMPPMEYGFGGTYVDAPFEGAPRVGAQPGAHLGVNGLNHAAHPTMVVNNHYYQPTWDHSQSYFMGAQPQQQIDPYYAAYPNATTQPNAQSNQGTYYPQDYYPQEYYPQNNQRGGNGSQGYFYGK